MSKQHLAVHKTTNGIEITVNGIVVWAGTHGEYSKAIAHPVQPPAPVYPFQQPRN